MSITITVVGEPKGQPRPRAFARKFGQKWSARVYDPGTAEGWKSAIAIAARQHIPATPMAGPVRVEISVFFARPKSHFRSGKHAGELKPGMPNRHTQKPDRDNLDKGILDTLKTLGFFVDDAQACAGGVEKRYVGPGQLPGAIVVIEEL